MNKIYGSPPVFKELKWPSSLKVLQTRTADPKAGAPADQAYWTMVDIFDQCRLSVISRITDLISKGVFKKS